MGNEIFIKEQQRKKEEITSEKVREEGQRKRLQGKTMASPGLGKVAGPRTMGDDRMYNSHITLPSPIIAPWNKYSSPPYPWFCFPLFHFSRFSYPQSTTGRKQKSTVQ